MKNIISCKTCGKELKGKQTLFCCTSCKNKAHQSYDSQKTRGTNRKKQLIAMFGGKCAICGYKKNMTALTFHHKDPNKKEFKLDIRSLSNRTFSKIQLELTKCILVCHNCHSELHYPEYSLEQ